jgi:hypothetical protein
VPGYFPTSGKNVGSRSLVDERKQTIHSINNALSFANLRILEYGETFSLQVIVQKPDTPDDYVNVVLSKMKNFVNSNYKSIV